MVTLDFLSSTVFIFGIHESKNVLKNLQLHRRNHILFCTDKLLANSIPAVKRSGRQHHAVGMFSAGPRTLVKIEGKMNASKNTQFFFRTESAVGKVSGYRHNPSIICILVGIGVNCPSNLVIAVSNRLEKMKASTHCF